MDFYGAFFSLFFLEIPRHGHYDLLLYEKSCVKITFIDRIFILGWAILLNREHVK